MPDSQLSLAVGDGSEWKTRDSVAHEHGPGGMPAAAQAVARGAAGRRRRKDARARAARRFVTCTAAAADVGAGSRNGGGGGHRESPLPGYSSRTGCGAVPVLLAHPHHGHVIRLRALRVL
jgi:hypothetical protein